jgi:hypothetical protein
MFLQKLRTLCEECDWIITCRRRDNVMGTDYDAAEERELDEFGIRLGKAFALSGEPPSEQAIAFTDETVVLPERSTEEIARFYDGVWQRIERAMRESTDELIDTFKDII